MKTTTFHPSRIGCPSIPGTMKGMIHSLDGVEDVKIRYEERALDVSYDDTKVSPQDIIEVVGRELGLALAEGEPGQAQENNVAATCPM